MASAAPGAGTRHRRSVGLTGSSALWRHLVRIAAGGCAARPLVALAREHAAWRNDRRQTAWGAVGLVTGLSIAILLIYTAVNAATKGYFRGRLRAAAALTLAMGLLAAVYAIRAQDEKSMSQWSDADRYLLERVRQSDGEAWSVLLGVPGAASGVAPPSAFEGPTRRTSSRIRFSGFYGGSIPIVATPVLRRYLFLLLRRRIIDAVRGRRLHACVAGEVADTRADESDVRYDASASWYVRRDEAQTRERAALAASMIALVEAARELDFRDLQLVEMLFYAQMRNEAIAARDGPGQQVHRPAQAPLDQAASVTDSQGAWFFRRSPE